MINKLFDSFTYLVMNDFTFENKREVKVFFIYQKINAISLSLMLKKNKRKDEAYYLNEAKKIVAKMIEDGSLNKQAEKYIKNEKKKRLLSIVIPAISICALAGAGVGIYFACHAPIKPEPVDPYRTNELTFVCEANNSSLGINYHSYYDTNTCIIPERNISFSYKVDDGEWVKCNISQHFSMAGETYEEQHIFLTDLKAGQEIRFRGDNDYWSWATSTNDGKAREYLTFFTNDEIGKFSVANNVMSLLSENNFATLDTIPSVGCFSFLFGSFPPMYVANISDASKLYLPPNLKDECYMSMFWYNTNLTKAPELSAKTMAKNCYQYMFRGCSSLEAAPELPATTLADDCYFAMFYECTSLLAAPKLPATILTIRCYDQMFCGCSSLTKATELPATILPQSCYSDMFSDCSLLNVSEDSGDHLIFNYVNEGELFATDGMFNSCAGVPKQPSVGHSYYWND